MSRFKSFLCFVCFSLLFVGFLCSSAFSIELVISDDGRLMGATNVSVNGDDYDVEFVNGTINEWFADESYNYSFTFTSYDDANLASKAILDIIDSDEQYDTDPLKINGIDILNSQAQFGYIITPYSIWLNNLTVSVWAARNAIDEAWDKVTGPGTTEAFFDTTGTSYSIALWHPTENMNPTPEPGTTLLLGAGLLSLAGLSRKKYFNKA